MPPPVEISIPTTSISPQTSDSKAFTLYNITLRLPLRTFVLQKRYSEFATLHTTLTALTGIPPPAPLPAKSWFRSTISSTELTETRRDGLERYLRAIAESPDRSWRDTPAWRIFLNLPNSTAGSAASASGIHPAIGLHGVNSAASAADPQTWLDLHREAKRALHDARLQLARRDAAADGGAGHASSVATEAGAAAKRELVKAGSLLAALSDGLKGLQESGKMGEGELRRRRDLVAAARVEKEGLEKLSASLASGSGSGFGGTGALGERNGNMPSAGDRAALLGGAGSRRPGRVLGAPLPETERTQELDNDGVVRLQAQLMDEQDRDVNDLAAIVRRQKEMGLRIRQEVDEQDELLKRLDTDVDRVAAKTKIARDRTRKLGG
jgi:regulator of vacuolar morphogenesis